MCVFVRMRQRERNILISFRKSRAWRGTVDLMQVQRPFQQKLLTLPALLSERGVGWLREPRRPGV